MGLERNNTNGKIDHSPQSINSKDSADAVTGACYTASQHVEEFAFDYGETLSTITSFNTQMDGKQQLTVDFENELAKAMGPQDNSVFKDFGLGKAVPMTGNYYGDGIIVW